MKLENDAATKIQTRTRVHIAKRQRARHVARVGSIRETARVATDDIRALSRPSTAAEPLLESMGEIAVGKICSRQPLVSSSSSYQVQGETSTANKKSAPDAMEQLLTPTHVADTAWSQGGDGNGTDDK